MNAILRLFPAELRLQAFLAAHLERVLACFIRQAFANNLRVR